MLTDADITSTQTDQFNHIGRKVMSAQPRTFFMKGQRTNLFSCSLPQYSVVPMQWHCHLRHNDRFFFAY